MPVGVLAEVRQNRPTNWIIAPQALVNVGQRGDLQLAEIESFAEHFHVDDDPAGAVGERGE